MTGSTYHANNLPPYTLPQHKTKTVIRSESHQGEGYNELSFEDQAGAEQVYIHAQRDMLSEVLNDQVTNVKNDSRLVVDNDHQLRIKNNHEIAVNGESRTQVDKDQTVIVKGSSHQQVTDLLAVESLNEISVKSGSKTTIAAGSELTLMAAGSSVVLSAGGVSIVGATVGINSGGAGKAGRSYAGTAPSIIDAEIIAPPVPQVSVVKLQAATMFAMELLGASVVKSCPLENKA
ncbi:bacteriophage T4 gp5 trimerisation domain-containing protein [Vibrio jasicida]|uniref:bacteriophage T4 gp5 trimerisation domain-containing protein n=1 Tax=Vibrio jasicida TaxID=766224 RepID=UPI000AE3508E|nr:type VI secretion system tip protein VgrG [Vibrio jasicida]